MVATACIRGEGRRKSIIHPSLGSQSKVGSVEKNQAEGEDCPMGPVRGNKLRFNCAQYKVAGITIDSSTRQRYRTLKVD